MTPDKKRAILEAAAKACGIELLPHDALNELWVAESDELARPWNTIDSSIDTASMCAKLEIDTIWTDAAVICADDSREHETEVRHDGTPEGKEAAWRLAASMVAAKTGGYTE